MSSPILLFQLCTVTLVNLTVNAMCKKFNKGSLPVASSLPSGGLTSPVPQQVGNIFPSIDAHRRKLTVKLSKNVHLVDSGTKRAHVCCDAHICHRRQGRRPGKCWLTPLLGSHLTTSS